jgi:phenylalanyl-tRNA synthetase beta chain
VGIKSINNVVDVTNFVMQLTGQPMHAFDYHKIVERSSGDAAVLGPRMATDKEPLTVLGGKKLTLTTQDIVLATDKEPADLAGVIGGGETEVDSNTTAVLLTCASFDMYAIRRASMRHGVFTEAAMRYTKGQSPLQNDRAVAYAMEQILKYAGGHQDGEVIDLKSYGDRVLGSEVSIHEPVTVHPDFINVRLGLSLSAGQITQLLTSVEFEVGTVGQELEIHAPFWRTDIEIGEDIVEEVGRLYGYDKLPLELPARSLSATAKNPLFEIRSRARDILSKAGANETLSYSFVHGDLLTRVGQDPAKAYSLGNALSPDLQYYRLSLTPSLLDKVQPNIKAGYDAFALFEIGKTHLIGELTDEGVPQEFERVACVIAAKDTIQGSAFYGAKRYLTALLDGLAITADVKYLPIEAGNDQSSTYYAAGRSAAVILDGIPIGYVGEYNRGVTRSLKIPVYCAGFELDIAALQVAAQAAGTRYSPISRFPKVEQDLSLQVTTDRSYADVRDIVFGTLATTKPENTQTHVEPLDIYQGEDTAHKNITFRIRIVSFERTLQSEAINKLLDDIADKAHQELGAKRL